MQIEECRLSKQWEQMGLGVGDSESLANRSLKWFIDPFACHVGRGLRISTDVEKKWRRTKCLSQRWRLHEDCISISVGKEIGKYCLNWNFWFNNSPSWLCPCFAGDDLCLLIYFPWLCSKSWQHCVLIPSRLYNKIGADDSVFGLTDWQERIQDVAGAGKMYVSLSETWIDGQR